MTKLFFTPISDTQMVNKSGDVWTAKPNTKAAEKIKYSYKNEILVSIIKGIFPNIQPNELVVVQSIIDIVLSQKLVKSNKSVAIKCFSFLKKKSLGYH